MNCTCSFSISASFMWLRDILNVSRTTGIVVVLRFYFFLMDSDFQVLELLYQEMAQQDS